MAKTPKCSCGNRLPCREHTGMEDRLNEDKDLKVKFEAPKADEPKFGRGHDGANSLGDGYTQGDG